MLVFHSLVMVTCEPFSQFYYFRFPVTFIYVSDLEHITSFGYWKFLEDSYFYDAILSRKLISCPAFSFSILNPTAALLIVLIFNPVPDLIAVRFP